MGLIVKILWKIYKTRLSLIHAARLILADRCAARGWFKLESPALSFNIRCQSYLLDKNQQNCELRNAGCHNQKNSETLLKGTAEYH